MRVMQAPQEGSVQFYLQHTSTGSITIVSVSLGVYMINVPATTNIRREETLAVGAFSGEDTLVPLLNHVIRTRTTCIHPPTHPGCKIIARC